MEAPDPASLAFLGTYVPRHAQRRLAARNAVPESAEETVIEGAALIADIAGWTALTERLDTMHAEGADELSTVLQEIFGSLESLVTTYGGEIVHVAGDGLLAIWPVERALDLPDATRRAVACGLRIQSDIAGQELFDGYRLRLRAGVGTGSLWLPLVGGPHRWFAPVGGDPLRQIAAALDVARPGDVIASPEVAAVAGAGLIGPKTTKGMVKVEDIDALAALPARRQPAPEPEILELFVPEIVAARARAGMTGHFAELRRATSVFVKVHDLEAAAEGPLSRLQRVTSLFHAAVRQFDGAVSVTLLDEAGLNMAGTWGGAQHAHEDDAVRALRAAMQFAAELADHDVGVGVATGQTFIGDVGSRDVRRFTLLGKPANLAARLAGSDSVAQVRCDAETMTAARHAIAFEEQGPIYFKGVLEATRTFRPVAPLETTSAESSGMVGRFDERRTLDSLLRDLVAGGGATVLVEGDAGIGKSTLVRDLLNESESLPIRRLILRGLSLDRSTPYQPWRAVFRTLVGDSDLDRTVGRHLDPTDLEYRGVVAEVLPVPGEVPLQVASMQPPDRAALTRGVLSRLFASLVGQAPLLLVMEDAHWYDTATWALAEEVVARCPNALVLLVTRGQGPNPEPAEIRLRSNATLLRLQPLTEDETVALACNRLDVASIPQELAELLHRRTEGNPLFTDALIRSFQDAGVIEITGTTRDVTIDRDALEQITLPSNVSAVLASRIDRLPLTHQTALKAASVIGRYFTAAEVAAVHPDAPSQATIKEQLETAISEGLITANNAAAVAGYRFSHVLMVEAAHGLLPAGTRQAMHAAFAGYLDSHDDNDPAVLAYHWAEADNTDSAIRAYDRAGAAAFAAGSYREVVAVLERAELLEASAPRSVGKARRLLTLGNARLRLGEVRGAQNDLIAATANAAMPLPRSRWRLTLGILWQVVRQIVHRLLPASARLRDPRTAERIAIGSEALFNIVSTAYGLQEPTMLAYAGLRATNEAERIEPTPTLAHGYAYLAFASGILGRRSLADRYYQRAVAAAKEAQSPAALADVALFHATLQVTVGNWEAAYVAARDAERQYLHLGNRRDHARSFAVHAYGLQRSGQFDRALDRYAALATLEPEDDVTAMWERIGTGKLLMRVGRLTEAIGVLTSIANQVQEVGETPTILSRLGFLSMALWQEGRLDAAVDTALDGLDLMEQNESTVVVAASDGFCETTRTLLEASRQTHDADLNQAVRRAVRSTRKVARRIPIVVPFATMSAAVVQARAGKTRRARRGFQKALRRAEELNMPYDVALILLEQGRSLGDQDALRRAEEQLSELGAAEDARLAAESQVAR